jgi:hypothetical protein
MNGMKIKIKKTEIENLTHFVSVQVSTLQFARQVKGKLCVNNQPVNSATDNGNSEQAR